MPKKPTKQTGAPAVVLQRQVRVRRLKKILNAQNHLEDRLLALKEMQSQREWAQSNYAFGQLYYLARLARQAP